MRLTKLLVVLLSILTFITHSQEEHKPGKMLAPPASSKKIVVNDPQTARNEILKGFKSAYKKEGMPSIAIFWNHKFDEQLSQWYQEIRLSQTGEKSVKASDKFEPKGGDEPAYERNVSGGGKIVSAQYVETRQDKKIREGFQESDSFDFSSGFTNTFLTIPAKIVDREAIMRLVQRDNSEEAGAEMISDFQKIETDALIGYADYLAEILLTPDSSGDTGWAFMVTVKSISDGQIIAMFKSTGNKPLDSTRKAKWVTTANGYEKQLPKRDITKPHGVGEQLAYETMKSLIKIWK